jgi:hypothetical protein
MHPLRRATPSCLLLLALTVACHPRRTDPDASPRASTVTLSGSLAAAPVDHAVDDPPDFSRGCLTLRDVAASHLARVEGSTLYYLDEGTGLWLVDVSQPEQPHVAAHVQHVGSPLSLFVREGIAWSIFVDWDRPSMMTTVIRVIDVRDREHPRVVGEQVRDGIAHDVRLVGGILYLLRQGPKGTTVESFAVRHGSLSALGDASLDGHPIELAASSAGLAAVTTKAAAVSVTWLDLPTNAPGALEVRSRVSFAGSVATPRTDDRVADADDGQTVHVVTCDASTCGPRDATRLRAIDFASTPPHIDASILVGRSTVARYVDDRLYVTRATDDGASSELAILTLYPSPTLAGKLRLGGTITTLVPRGDALVTLGRTSTGSGRGRLVVHDIDIRRPSVPVLRGTVTFGSDWTASAPGGAAIAFDPGSRLAAVPFTAFRESDARYGVGTQLVDLTEKGPRLGPTLRAGEPMVRAVFVGRRLLVIGPGGVETIDYGSRMLGPLEAPDVDRIR